LRKREDEERERRMEGEGKEECRGSGRSIVEMRIEEEEDPRK